MTEAPTPNASRALRPLLFLAHRVPYPPNKGDKIRAFHELRVLHARGHAVHLFTFADDPAEREVPPRLREICASVTILPLDRRLATVKALAGVIGGAPLSLRYFSSATMRAAVERAIHELKPAGIVVYSSSMAQYVPARLRSRTVADLVDIDSEKWRDYAEMAHEPLATLYRLEWRRLRAYEQAIVREYAATVLTTDREAVLLDEPGATLSTRIKVFVNGVDAEFFCPADGIGPVGAAVPEGERPFFTSRPGPRLVFTGAMDYRANVDAVVHFADAMFPRIRSRYPDAEFLIVGSRPARAVTRLATRSGVVVTGFVQDIRPYLRSATACVVPLRVARGIQNKLLEAMACGCAVVATPQAAAGLGEVSAQELLIRSDAGSFADAVIELIERADRRAALGASARRYVAERHDWDRSIGRFVDLIEGRISDADDRARPDVGHERLAPAALRNGDEAGRPTGSLQAAACMTGRVDA
jgi:sugar transferase (PEP-CTERM/EpsH1 system associated)